ncbi:MAG: GWxTD domain-containing protein [bacterium]
MLFYHTFVLALGRGDGEIKFDLDYASFRYEAGKSYLEIYYSFARQQLQYVRQDSQWVASFEVDANLYQADSLVKRLNWQGKSVVRDRQGVTARQPLFTLTNFIIYPGQYRYLTRLKDTTTGRKGVKELTLNVTNYPDTSLSISDVELANSVQQDFVRAAFSKNGYRVIPNPGALYNVAKPVLYFYAEIYNLKEDLQSTYSVEYAILSNEGARLRTFPRMVRPKAGTSVVDVGGLNVISFPTGSYFFEISVRDSSTQATFARRKKFYIFKPGGSQRSLAVGGSEKVSLSLEDINFESAADLDDEFYSASYLATKEETKIFKTLDLEGKRKFLIQFWTKRDTDPTTPKNELRAEHLARLRFVNREFSGFRKGWKTDRGRVIMKYGEPDAMEKNPNLGNSRAYEIWRYFNKEGGLVFVFVDRRGFRDLELVHSNARGQVYNPDWKEKLAVQ